MWTPWIASPAHPTLWAPPVSGPRRLLIDALLRLSALLVRTAVRVQRAPLIAPVPSPAPSPRPAATEATGAVADRRWSTPQATVVSPRASAASTRPSMPVVTSRVMAEREFHAEAGAPEGALYVDGQFIGWLSGVSRL